MSEFPNIKANFSFWDTVDIFSVIQVGWLWCELEPPAHGVNVFQGRDISHNSPPILPQPPSQGEKIIQILWREFYSENPSIRPCNEVLDIPLM